jgi:Fe-S cluster assembly protein SufD
MSAAQQYIDIFRQTKSMINKHSAPVLNALRDDAMACFEKAGLPTKKIERYRYIDMEAMFAPDYGLNLNKLDIPVNPYDVFHCDVPNMSTLLYFVVNDAFYDKLLPKVKLPEGVILGSLRQAAEKHPDLVSKYYGKFAKIENESVVALNTAFAQDGLFIYVPKNVKVEKTVQVINILRSDVDLMANRRVLIVLEEGASLDILFCDHTMDENNFLSTQVMEVYAGPNSHLDLYELEETGLKSRCVRNMYVRQEADSNVLLNNMTLYNGMTRNTTEVSLVGEGAEIGMYGMAIEDREQLVDNNTFIDHVVGRCRSRELYKYVLDDSSTGAFAGKVLVRPNAQKTDSQQTNRDLCMTKTAHMYTQPQLEIYADDVKCAHGAAVGQLDESALFYMRARGIDEHEALLLLMFAFVNDVIDTINIDVLKDRLHHLVEKRFRKELSGCASCKICK